MLHWRSLRPLGQLLAEAAAAVGAREHQDHYRRDNVDPPHQQEHQQQPVRERVSGWAASRP